jgi:hypothetical protein
MATGPKLTDCRSLQVSETVPSAQSRRRPRGFKHASDTCVRQAGIDPETGSRYLEELVFEVVHKRSPKKTKARAKGFAARGVRVPERDAASAHQEQRRERNRDDPWILDGGLA